MQKPIRIYLDTSDYADFSRPDIGEKDKEILDFLSSKVKSKEIEVGYSYWIVTELIQDSSAEFRVNRILRAKTIKDLCGENAFPYPSDFAEGDRYPNKGIWMPKTAMQEFSATKLEAILKENILKSDRINRNFRRKFANRNYFKSFVRESAKEIKITREDFDGLPVTEEFVEGNFLVKFISGTISQEKMDIELTKWIADPELFFDFWYSYSGKENPLKKMVEKPFIRLTEDFEKLKQKYKETVSKYNQIKSDIKSIEKNLKELGISRNLEKDLGKISLPKIEFKFDHSKMLLGMNYLNTYMEKLLLGSFEPKRSDIIDLMNIYQIHDVDLLRCDKKMFSIFKDSEHINPKKMIGSRGDIISRIIDLIDERKQIKS